MQSESTESLISKIEELQNRLAETEQLIDAIKAGEVDAFAINENNRSEVYTLQSGDYAYRVLIEEFGEGAVNITEEGLIVYTNVYFADLLRLPYEKVVGSVIEDFIHPGSMEKFRSLLNQALQGKSKGEVNLNVNNCVVPVYISLTSLQPKLATIGIIVTDFTEKKKQEAVILQYQKELEQKNRELEQSNIELNSFTYIASHDLQEPLRKIQTFCNRILDTGYESFAPNTKDYFRRITASSARMQSLITSLLNYSRLNTAEIVYTATDLNRILETVKDDLREQIEETGTIIDSEVLPTLNVVPHQLNQLFSNILSNAIKYRNPHRAPLIKIDAREITINNSQPEQFPPDGSYHQISISDNGIGFEQQYANRIFELFQRLHTRNEIDGTGIGLAICKKIMQNHQGYILATGSPGVGSTFHLYFPSNEPVK